MDLESRSLHLALLAESLPAVPESSTFFVDPTRKHARATGVRNSCFEFLSKNRTPISNNNNNSKSWSLPKRVLPNARLKFPSHKSKTRVERLSEGSSSQASVATGDLWMEQPRYKNLSKLTHAKWSGLAPDNNTARRDIKGDTHTNNNRTPEANSVQSSAHELATAVEASETTGRVPRTAPMHLWTPLFRTKQLEACIEVLHGGTHTILEHLLHLTRTSESWCAGWNDTNILTYYCWIYCTAPSSSKPSSKGGNHALREQVLVPEYTDPLSALSSVLNALAMLLQDMPESETALNIIRQSWVRPDMKLVASVSKRREMVTLMTLFDEIVEGDGERPNISGPNAARFDHFINSQWRAHACNVAAIGSDDEAAALEESKRRRVCVMDGTEKNVFTLRDCRCSSRKAVDRLVCTDCSLQWYINQLARSQDCTLIACVGGCGARVVLSDLTNLIETDGDYSLLHRRVLESHRLHFPGFIYCPSRAGCSDGMRLESPGNKVANQQRQQQQRIGEVSAAITRHLPAAIVTASRVGQVIGRLTGMCSGGNGGDCSVTDPSSGAIVPVSIGGEAGGLFNDVDDGDIWDDDSDDDDDAFEDEEVMSYDSSEDFAPLRRSSRIKSMKRRSTRRAVVETNPSDGRDTSTSDGDPGGFVQFECLQCLFEGCVLCGSSPHAGKTCQEAVAAEALQVRQRADVEYQRTLRRVLEQGAKLPSRTSPMLGKFRPCFYCGVATERIDGCNSIKCVCCRKTWHWNHGSHETANKKLGVGEEQQYSRRALNDFAREVRQYESLRPPTFARSHIGSNRQRAAAG